ncbi:hypothetical protein [Natronorarus salvus]|uniref:hypothetical protein n=1 Tax=Natronorarus salvus TaxID=3117733 RepID=UPI002F26910A
MIADSQIRLAEIHREALLADGLVIDYTDDAVDELAMDQKVLPWELLLQIDERYACMGI